MTTSISDAQWRSASRRLVIALKERDENADLGISCSLCTALFRLISIPRSRRCEVLFDITDDHHSCSNHAAILPSDKDSQIRLLKPAGQRLVYIQTVSDQAANIRSGLGIPWEPYLVKDSQTLEESEDNVPLQNSPRLVDRKWIDIELLNEWHSICTESHTSTCGNTNLEKDESFPNFLLIDVRKRCLVRIKRSCRYVALSYVWGHTNTFLTKMENVEQLLQPNALHPDHVQLPKTIAQAIALTLALDEQYLWVDALCIVQDGPDKSDQLNAMASLFTNATLVIVAAEGGHADAGFRGLHGISEARCAEQKVAPISPDRHLVRPSSKHV